MSSSTRNVEPISDVIDRAIANRVFPAASVEIGTPDDVLWARGFGTLTYDATSAATTTESIFDLASLTKVVATATIAMRLTEGGVLALDAPIASWLSGWQRADRRSVRVRDLLEHSSGLPAWKPLFETCSSRSAFLAALEACPLEFTPRTASVYSDLGFILLGFILESAAGATLDRQWDAIRDAVFGDWRAMPLSYHPSADWVGRIAPTRVDSSRRRVLVGEVDDDNAWAIGGVAGHAGLFGTAGALGRFARAVMHALAGRAAGTPPLIGPATMRAFVAPSSVPGSSRALGWDTMRPTSSCGTRMSVHAIGHTGFTGTSLWIDPERGLYVVLLTNRVHPHAGAGDAIQQVRRELHDAVVDSLS